MISDDELRRIVSFSDDCNSGKRGIGGVETGLPAVERLARELLDARAQIGRLTGLAPIASAIDENLRARMRTGIDHGSFATNKLLLDALESCEHENARLKSVLLDQRLDQGAEQLRERCAIAAENHARENDAHNLIVISAGNAVRDVPVDGRVSATGEREKDGMQQVQEFMKFAQRYGIRYDERALRQLYGIPTLGDDASGRRGG